jgi:hypothetical protein
VQVVDGSFKAALEVHSSDHKVLVMIFSLSCLFPSLSFTMGFPYLISLFSFSLFLLRVGVRVRVRVMVKG